MNQPGSQDADIDDAVSRDWARARCRPPGAPVQAVTWNLLRKGPRSIATSGTRSPSPVTSPESFNHYAESTSSLATSYGAEVAAECGFVDDEDKEMQRKPKSEEEPPDSGPSRPPTPAARFAAQQNNLRTGSPIPPSALRNSVSLYQLEDQDAKGQDEPETDSDESECESGDDNISQSEEDEDDNEWSGQNGNLESLVISAVDWDYSLAAFLIPLLHRDFNLALRSKIERWRCSATSRASSDGSSDGSPAADHTATELPTGKEGALSRKRRRTNSDDGRQDEKGDEGDDGDEDGEKRGKTDHPPDPPFDSDLLLACPFHKHNPIKYGAHDNPGAGKKPKYRACAGPGFRSVQRLKEHLRRVHSPVQCERCKETFSTGNGRDRAQCLAELADHRKREEPCELRSASLKEGIDEAQWAKLDRHSRKKNQEVHRVEKWFEIWDVLFPAMKRPESPWHEISTQIGKLPKHDEEYFISLFLNILGHKIQHGDIPLPDPNLFNTDPLRESLKGVVQTTFRTYVSIRENLLGTSSSDSQSHNRPSLPGGGPGSLMSSTHRSSLGTAAPSCLSQPVSATTAATSLGTHGLPTGRPSPPTNSYAMDPSPYGINMALPNQPSSSPPFLSSLSPVPGQIHHGGMHTPFPDISTAACTTDPASSFYYGYMFPPQGPAWMAAGNLQFTAAPPPPPPPPPPHVPGGAAGWLFDDLRGFGGGGGERGGGG